MSDFNETLIFTTYFRKILVIELHEKSAQWEPRCCMRTDRHDEVNPLNAELNPICYLLALLGAHHFLHVSRIRVKSLIFRLLSYIYIYIHIYIYIYIYDISSLRVNSRFYLFFFFFAVLRTRPKTDGMPAGPTCPNYCARIQVLQRRMDEILHRLR